MLVRRRQALEVLSISALDLFASALGVFILMAILMFPYYLRQPSVDAELQGARAELSASGRSLDEAERMARESERERAEAEAALSRARERLRLAQAAATAAADELRQAPAPAQSVRRERGSTGQRRGALAINDLDLVFVMDTTGSMRRELADLRASLLGIVRILHRLAPTLRIGFVAFKDRGDAYVTRTFPLSAMDPGSFRELVEFVGGLSAEGGGDDPEPVDEALRAAIDMAWRPDAQGQIVLVGDAPAHAAGWQPALDAIAAFRRSAPDDELPRTVSAILTGRHPNSEAFFGRVAEAGGGLFTRHQGPMIESVLLSVLRADERGAAR